MRRLPMTALLLALQVATGAAVAVVGLAYTEGALWWNGPFILAGTIVTAALVVAFRAGGFAWINKALAGWLVTVTLFMDSGLILTTANLLGAGVLFLLSGAVKPYVPPPPMIEPSFEEQRRLERAPRRPRRPQLQPRPAA